MSISGINNDSSIYQLLQLYGTQSTSGTSTDSTTSTTSSTSSDSAKISKGGELMGKLAQLSQTDPTKFKEVCADIASKLSTAAQSDGSTDSMMAKMASQFKEAASSGDASALLPPKPSTSGANSDALNAYTQNQQMAQDTTSASSQKSSIDSIIKQALSDAGVSSDSTDLTSLVSQTQNTMLSQFLNSLNQTNDRSTVDSIIKSSLANAGITA